MRQPISWSGLADAAVGVWGVGVEGRASVRRLRLLGVTPVLVDDTPPAGEPDGLGVLATATGGLDALTRCDVVVKSPGISRYRPEVAHLEAAGVAVCGGLGLFMEEADPARVVCITGTKGKSTTTALTVHLLSALGYGARAGGNIGHPPWDPEEGAGSGEADPSGFWVIETSSFQVPDLAHGPRVVAVTSLSPDHLDWHGSVRRYYEDKLSLCTKPGVALALAAGTDAELRAHASLLGPHARWLGDDEVRRDEPWRAGLGLPGPHNARNASMARAVLAGLGIPEADDDERLADAASGFTGLPSRCRSLGRAGTVEFVDDSLSTNVLPAQAALEAFADRPVALLVGGLDRGVDYGPLGASVAARATPTLVVTMPDNGRRIGAAVRAAGNGDVEVVDATSLESAVDTAYDWARGHDDADGVVLLSPAAPSFGRFSDFRDRAAAFAEAAARCGVVSQA
jgi:UDP-N-acetylmuramoyl-L-alanine---L-glutamate ligase